MEWRFTNDAPIYSQIISQVTLAIVSGALSPGEKLASVRDMATEAGVNPNTMQRALGELEREGLVYSQRTSGRFVTEDGSMIENAKRVQAQAQIDKFLDAMIALGYNKDEIVSMLSGKREGEKQYGDTGM